MDHKKQILTPAFAKVLASVLKSHRITNYRLANGSELDPAHVSRLVRGLRQRPTPETLQKILLALARFGVGNDDISLIQASAGFAPFSGNGVGNTNDVSAAPDVDEEAVVPAIPISPTLSAPPQPLVAEIPDHVDAVQALWDIKTYSSDNTPPDNSIAKPLPTADESADFANIKLHMGDRSRLSDVFEEPKLVTLNMPEIRKN